MRGFHIGLEPMMDCSRVLVRQDLASATIQRIVYALAEIGARSGVRFRLATHSTPSDAPTIAYGVPAPPGALYIPFDAECWSRTGEFRAIGGQNGHPLWGNVRANRPQDVDLIGGVFRLLTLADESAIGDTARDRFGIFDSPALPRSRLAQAQMPLVEYLVTELVARLGRSYARFSIQPPRWPGGRVSAMALSHDTDCVSFAFWQEIAYNTVKIIARRDAVFARLLLDSFSKQRWGRNNPYNGFNLWRHFSDRRALKSCFFLFHRLRAPRDMNDCRATVFTSEVDWRMLRDMYDDGHEIGLHAAINAKDTAGEFESVKQQIEDRLQRTILGVRHHYWAIDWQAPWRTWRRHAQAGLLYDSSIAWRDIPGLRAGTCMPFRPYDLDAERPLDFIVIPCAVADQHVVVELKGEQRDNGARMLLSRIGEAGGVAVFDWHTEAACNAYQYRGYGEALSNLLDWMAEHNAPAATTPGAAAAYWRQRVGEYTPEVEGSDCGWEAWRAAV